MAQLVYASGSHRLITTNHNLLHLQIAIQHRFGKGEGFNFGYADESGGPVARTFIWLHPSIPLQFIYDDEEPVKFNPELAAEYVKYSYDQFGLSFGSDTRRPLVDPDSGLS
ncbi:DUF7882 family protein [Rhodococcus sp. JT-3]|uniref:DUF7882 family protein n=1 Tax=Rhodococcus sp. JT-3 TaxID=1973213 RepID=UPI001302FB78|nr:hypothetical protein [Rhodococcus sp. JT-3]